MRAVALILLTSLTAILPALAQQRPAATPAAAPDPALEAAQRAFDALPEAERRAIQDDLIWASDFTATISGSYGRRTHDAILSFKRVNKLRPDALLDDRERKLLTEAANRARAAAKFARIVDARTGAAYGLPRALLTASEQRPTGTRWTSADGAVVVESAIAQGGVDDLPAAFERVLNAEVPGRKVTYKLLRPEFFVVAGETGPRSFYTRFGLGKDRLSGYTISYPTARAKAFERTVIALANSFEPMAGTAPATVATTSGGGATATTAPAQATERLERLDQLPAGAFLTGVVVAPGRIATAALAAACPDLSVNGHPARVAATPAPGLALVEADTSALPPLASPAADAAAGEVLVIGFVGAGQKPVLTIASGDLLPGSGQAHPRVAVSLHREAGGSAVFSRAGAWLGLLAPPPQAPRLVAGLVPATSHALLPAGTLASGTGSASGTASAGALLGRVSPSLVSLRCAVPVALPRP